ncbi:DUF2490 domain-containing protein [Carboxylicivirga sp. RSCT41]|uniref:DUF2490 domain-containing protein n=1 Tax=Carboxylicivirga agarovorans TaxID=3417570 RepID=UPI003D32F9EC
MKKRRILIFPLLLISLLASAQQHFDFNLFNGSGELRLIYVQRHRLNDKYTLNIDAGSYLGLGNNIWTRWGFRGNISRKINDFYSYDLGFMYNRIHYKDDILNDDIAEEVDVTRHEYRPHQAFHISYPRFQASSLKHRFRLEERMFTHVHNDVRDFKIRLRYRILHQGRFDGKPIAPKSFFYRTFAEFNFNIYQEAEDVFWVRGRYCAGLGYQFNSKLSADTNYYLEHTKVARGVDQVVTHIFQVTLRQTLYWNQ